MQLIAQHARGLFITLRGEQALTLRDRGLFDVFDIPHHRDQFQALLDNPNLFIDVLWEMTDQAALTFEQFASAVVATNGQELWDAFIREIAFFFLSALQNVLGELPSERSDARSEESPPATRTTTETTDPASEPPATSSELGKTSTAWEAFSVSTQEPSVTENSTTCISDDNAPSGTD